MVSLSVAVAAYLIGSFPTAYVIGKRVRGINISEVGTGNIGAMNAYEVTGSKIIGITVAGIDILKGLIVTLIAQDKFGLGIVAAFFAVLGHNYSIFMRFKGGRGLATAAGSLMIIQPVSVAIYLATYLLLRAAKLKLYLSSVIGIVVASIPVLLELIGKPTSVIFAALLLIVVLSKHLVPLKNELQNGIQNFIRLKN